MKFLESNILIYVLCLILLVLILFLGYSLIKVVRSNIYHERKLKKAEEVCLNKTGLKNVKVKKIHQDYSVSEKLQGKKQRSAAG